MKYILSLDLGTNANRAILFNKKGHAVFIARKKFKQYTPKPGWVEHDAEEIWKTAKEVLGKAVREAGKNDIRALGITNQRETIVIWDSRTGKSLHRAIVWQDRRTASVCDRLRNNSKMVMKKTGLFIDPYFSATKIAWLLKNSDKVRKTPKKFLRFGTIDTWILWKLTNGETYATDVSNASRTLLFDLKELKWDKELCKLFKVPIGLLPKVCASSFSFGKIDKEHFGKPIPITGIIGDQQGALFGQGCFIAGKIKTTYGTGAFVVLNTGSKFVFPKNGIVSTIAWRIGDKTTYAMEGSVFACGASINWMVDNLNIAKSASELGDMANNVEDNGGVHVVSAFAGLGAPYWKANARATISGLSFYNTKEHIARATFEGISHQVTDVIEAMRKISKLSIKSMRVDGGVTKSSLMLQHQADMANIEVLLATESEATALGGAMIAGLKVGFWKMKDLDKIVKTSKTFRSKIEGGMRNKNRVEWKEAINKVINI